MTLPKGSLSYTRGHLGYKPQTVATEGGLPIGSPEAAEAVERVRAKLAAEYGTPKTFTLGRERSIAAHKATKEGRG